MKRTKLFTFALAGALAPLCAGAEDFAWHGRVASGRTLEIKGVNGSIEASGGAGEAEVRAVKTSRRSDPDSVEIKVIEHADGVTICAVYPTPNESSRPNECRPGEGGRMNTRDNDVDVHFTVKVPRGVSFTARTVNGDVEATGLDGDAKATTVNGSIRLSTSGRAEAQTVNGSIRADAGRADWTGERAFKTVNGSITLTLPASTAAEVHASTVNGEIETDFPLTVTGRFSRRSLSGTIGGGGGRSLELETVNGGIRLRKSS
jgi:DUF4097 and DUF4098 domain-containing protein YvlB